MVIKLLHTVLLFLFPSMTVIGQVLDTDTLCYKNNTVYQELIIKRINKKRIYFALSSIKKGEQVDVYKGFTEDGSLYPVIEYWYEDPDIPLSIRVNYDMGVARISFAENLSLPYIYKLKKK